MWIFRSSVPGAAWPAFPPAPTAIQLAIFGQLMRSQWWPARDLRRWQLQQLSQLVRHAQATVPYYWDRLAQVAALDSVTELQRAWRSIPILQRSDIQTHGDALVSTAVPPAHGQIDTVQTSGTTGTPIACKVTGLTKTMLGANTLRWLNWRQWDPQKTHAVIRYDPRPAETRTDGEGEARPYWTGLVGQVLQTGAGYFLGVQADIATQAAWLARHNPHYLMTYATNALHLARYCAEHGIEVPNLESIEMISEIVTPEQRQVCRDVWNASVFANYSALETGAIAYQCPRNEHYHIAAESTALEILDDDGEPCQPGEVGRVILTPLHNFAMPLIRYEIGDYAEVGTGRCSCGRNLPVLTRILGRQRNMLVLPSGAKLWPVMEAEMFTSVAPVRQFQVIQHGMDDIEARLVVDTALTADQEDRLRQAMQDEFQHPFPIRFTYEQAIPRSPGGKYEEFICRV